MNVHCPASPCRSLHYCKRHLGVQLRFQRLQLLENGPSTCTATPEILFLSSRKGLGTARLQSALIYGEEFACGWNNDVKVRRCSHKVVCGMWIYDKGATVLGRLDPKEKARLYPRLVLQYQETHVDMRHFLKTPSSF